MSYGKGPASSGPSKGASPQEMAECDCPSPAFCGTYGCAFEAAWRAGKTLDRAQAAHAYAKGERSYNSPVTASALQQALANEAAMAAEVAELRAAVSHHKRWRFRRFVVDVVVLVLIVIWGVLG